MREVFLRPGELHVGDAADRVRTLLGSCVAITLRAPRLHVGAMCHFLLSSRVRAAGTPLDARYGDEALTLMLQGMARRGAGPDDCEAGLFGGGHMFPGSGPAGALHVGRRNGEAARELLGRHGLPIGREDLFGVGHRRLVFDIGTGRIEVIQVQPLEPAA
jgi:chemotaxis protein CheD